MLYATQVHVVKVWSYIALTDVVTTSVRAT